jgi:predicted transcriptional regulator
MLRKGLFWLAKGNRDRLNIFSDMLTCAIEETRKTEIMCKVGLSTIQMHKYVNVLTRSELLEVQKCKKTVTYRTTPKGKSFLETYDALVEFLS